MIINFVNISILQSDKGLYVCMPVCGLITPEQLNQLIWLNFFLQLCLGHGVVIGQKITDPGSTFFRKSGKTRSFEYLLYDQFD